MVKKVKGIKISKNLQEKFKFGEDGTSTFGSATTDSHSLLGHAGTADVDVEGPLTLDRRIGDALFGLPKMHGVTDVADLQELVNNASIFDGFMIYLTAASTVSPFVDAEKFYFCEEGTWHPSPFVADGAGATPVTFNIFTDADGGNWDGNSLADVTISDDPTNPTVSHTFDQTAAQGTSGDDLVIDNPGSNWNTADRILGTITLAPGTWYASMPAGQGQIKLLTPPDGVSEQGSYDTLVSYSRELAQSGYVWVNRRLSSFTVNADGTISDIYFDDDDDGDGIPDTEDPFTTETVNGTTNVVLNTTNLTNDPIFETDSSGDVMIDASPSGTNGNFELDDQGDVMPAAS